jgi:hypothetical protein
VDVAEHAHDARAIEADRFGFARRVAAEIEAFRLRQREHIVERLVAIGEIHHGAHGHREHVRHERFVALVHDRANRLTLFEGTARRRFEIDDAAAQVGQVARAGTAWLLNFGPSLGRPRDVPDVQASANRPWALIRRADENRECHGREEKRAQH